MARLAPRDEIASQSRILAACRREHLAKQAMYLYPRGGQSVKGPSIRLAEVLAQNWGNMDFGTREVERRDGESEMLAFAWDIETNVRAERRFTVRHIRDKQGGGVALSDERDIYELGANMAARRLRACILQIVPGDVVDLAIAECAKTVATGGTKSFPDKVRELVEAFGKLSITVGHIETRLGHAVGEMLPEEFSDLVAIYTALKDKQGKASDYFAVPKQVSATEATTAATEALRRGRKPGTSGPDTSPVLDVADPFDGDEGGK
jgi:hypothetical protein